MIIKGKRLYVTRMRNRQFLCSKEALMASDGKSFECSDGIYVKTFMPDLTFGEGFRYVDLHIELEEFPGAHKMWLAGHFRHRFITEEEPEYSYDCDGSGFSVAGGDAVYLSWNCDVDYFPRLSEGIFPIWVECLPGEPYNEDDYRMPLVFDSIGMLDRNNKGRVSFSSKLRGQLEKFLDDNNLSFLHTPVECRMIIEIQQKIEVEQSKQE